MADPLDQVPNKPIDNLIALTNQSRKDFGRGLPAIAGTAIQDHSPGALESLGDKAKLQMLYNNIFGKVPITPTTPIPEGGGGNGGGILDWADRNKWPLMGGAAAAALLGGGAYAYHRNRKKKKNAYGEEEKEAQYKPYTSYTPPIISPYHMIKKSDTPLGQPEKTLKDDPFMGGFFSYPVAPMPRVKNLNDNIEGLPSKEDPYNPPGLPTPPPGGGIALSEAEGAVPKPSQIDRLAYNLAKMVGTGSGAGQGVSASPAAPAIPASPAAPEDPGAIDEDFLAQEGGPDYLKTQDPSWFEQNKWPLLGGLAAAGLLGGGAYAYHRSKQKENKKDSTEDDDEEKEAQYKPYTSYTPPIISPYKFFNYYGQSS